MDRNTSQELFTDEKSFDFLKLLYRTFKYWYILSISLLITIGGALYFYKSTLPQFKVSARLLITGNQSEIPTIGSAEGALPGINIGAFNSVENQLIILTSKRQIEKTLSHLDFFVSYFERGAFVQKEIYNDSPFKVILETSSDNLEFVLYNLTFTDDKTYVLTKEGNKDFRSEHLFLKRCN